MSRLIINEKDPAILEKPSDKLKQKQKLLQEKQRYFDY